VNKILAIYFSASEVLGYPLDHRFYFESYAELIEYWAKKGLKTVIVRGDTYEGDGVFSSHSVWNGETYEKVDEPIKANLIWNRDSGNTIPHIDDCPILNNPDFDELCRDKLKSYEKLKSISGKTFILQSYSDVEKHVANFAGEKIVLKPRFGEGAYGVYVLEAAEIKEDLYEDWSDILMQEFLDSSDGIEGLVEGLHEVNVVCINGQFAGARIKKPAEGSLVSSANGAQQGQVWGIHQKDIPAQLWEDVQKIVQSFVEYDLCLFRADFVRTVQGEYKLIEINSRPGVMHPDKEGKDFYWDMNGAVAEVILGWFERN
jgi:glutathione synthase/RimK-type ligase-like ATP-grasp enzyme